MLMPLAFGYACRHQPDIKGLRCDTFESRTRHQDENQRKHGKTLEECSGWLITNLVRPHFEQNSELTRNKLKVLISLKKQVDAISL